MNIFFQLLVSIADFYDFILTIYTFMDTFATFCREAVGTMQVLLWTTILSNYDLMQFYLLLSHYSSPKQVVLWETFWRLILQSQGLKVDNCNASMHFLLNYEQQLCFIRCAHCGKKIIFCSKKKFQLDNFSLKIQISWSVFFWQKL